MTERHKVVPAVFVAVINPTNQVLLQRRANTGYMDGRCDLPSGHMEAGELPNIAAARELKEEAGIEVEPGYLELFSVYVNESTPNLSYLGMMYYLSAELWGGEYQIGEPHKCDDMGFYDLHELPNVTPQVRDGLSHLDSSTIGHFYYGKEEVEA